MRNQSIHKTGIRKDSVRELEIAGYCGEIKGHPAHCHLFINGERHNQREHKSLSMARNMFRHYVAAQIGVPISALEN